MFIDFKVLNTTISFGAFAIFDADFDVSSSELDVVVDVVT
jgi:outer membrane usher protein FimD/PapC